MWYYLSMPINVSVLILNWNGRNYLEPCLNALRGQTYRAFEVILVENGSVDGSAALVRETFGEWLAEGTLKLVELAQNTGFSGGNLEGLRHAEPEARYIATLNNDTEADSHWLETLVNSLENRSDEWAAVCGAMLFASDTARIASAGIEVRKNGLALDGRGGELWKPGAEEEIFGVCAGAALYRRKAIEETGFFDPAFFAYLEDADLAWRLRLRGYRSLYVPDAKVMHLYSGTGGQGSPFKSFQLGRNRLWVILKDMPGALLLRYLPLILFYDLAAVLYTLLFRRDIHSLRGRLAALRPRHLKRLRQQRREIQQNRRVSIAELRRWLASSGFGNNLALQRTMDELAIAIPGKRK